MASDRNAFLVLGMHRSGTSAFAGTLGHLGLVLPAELMAPDPANANGYFESWELAKLHNRMLRAGASAWDDWSPIPDSWFDQPSAATHAKRVGAFLEREFSRARNFAIKDPRICRVVPIWQQALKRFDASVRVILPLRHPAAVTRSLAARDGVLLGEAHLLWLRYMLDAERATRDVPRVFVTFEALLEDWRAAIDRVATRLDFAWPRAMSEAAPEIDTFLQPRLRHHRVPPLDRGASGPAGLLALEAWEVLAAFTRREPAPDAIAHLDRLRGRLDRIPSAYALPFGIGAVAGPMVRMISRLRVKPGPAKEILESRRPAETGK